MWSQHTCPWLEAAAATGRRLKANPGSPGSGCPLSCSEPRPPSCARRAHACPLHRALGKGGRGRAQRPWHSAGTAQVGTRWPGEGGRGTTEVPAAERSEPPPSWPCLSWPRGLEAMSSARRGEVGPGPSLSLSSFFMNRRLVSHCHPHPARGPQELDKAGWGRGGLKALRSFRKFPHTAPHQRLTCSRGSGNSNSKERPESRSREQRGLEAQEASWQEPGTSREGAMPSSWRKEEVGTSRRAKWEALLGATLHSLRSVEDMAKNRKQQVVCMYEYVITSPSVCVIIMHQ